MSVRHAADDGTTEPTDAASVGLSVVAGSPTPEELAAVVAVLGAAAEQQAAAGAARVDADPRRRWNAAARGASFEGLPEHSGWR